MSNQARTRRHRRTDRNARRGRSVHGKPRHQLQAGRTGSVHQKREPSKKPAGLHTVTPLVEPESVRLRARFG